MNSMGRSYRLQQRAERQGETRRRIVEAAVDLHGTVGPAQTTVTDIAARAGVGRQTVYRHFPDELTLVRACSGLYWERHPLPDLEPWRGIANPDARLRVALTESYAYHRQTENMMIRVFADVADHPVMQPYYDHWRRAADVVAAAWGARGNRRLLLRAAVGHAIVFPTWRSLVREQGLTDRQAVELMLRLTTPR